MPRFSIIIPAHNEQRFIARSIRAAARQDHADFEIIVVENGSSDGTLQQALHAQLARVRIFSIEDKGASIAKNFGAKLASRDSQWIIFLDADTLVKRNFLVEVEEYLSRHDGCTVGTVSLTPIERSLQTRLWFFCYNIWYRACRGSSAIQIVSRRYFDRYGFDEQLTIGEDYLLLRQLRKHGRFFYLNGTSAATSARRMLQHGMLFLSMQWLIALVPPLRRRMTYAVVR